MDNYQYCWYDSHSWLCHVTHVLEVPSSGPGSPSSSPGSAYPPAGFTPLVRPPLRMLLSSIASASSCATGRLMLVLVFTWQNIVVSKSERFGKRERGQYLMSGRNPQWRDRSDPSLGARLSGLEFDPGLDGLHSRCLGRRLKT